MRKGSEYEKYLNHLFDEYENGMPKRQKQILDAAIKVFSKKGYQGSRTSEIAREAKVSEGTIFNYYACKKDILIAMIFEIIKEFVKPMCCLSMEEINKDNDKSSIEESLHRLMIDRLNLVRKNYPLIKTILIESIYHEEILEILSKELYPRLIDLVDSYVEKNIENGNFRNIDKKQISRSIVSSTIGYLVLDNVVPEYFSGENDEDEVGKIVNVILYGIANEKYK